MQEPGTTSTSGSEGASPLVSLVWLQREQAQGLFQHQDPGLLIGRLGGRISLVTLNGKVFEAEKREIAARWPWWQFGQGLRLTVAGKTYWFAWTPGSATSSAWGMNQRAEVVSTLAGREGLDSVRLARPGTWRRYLKA